MESVDVIAKTQRQFLVHSFIYYHLNDSIWGDERYDRCCKELLELIIHYPGKGPYYDICKELDESGSGFYLKRSDYPPEIVSTALRLLFFHRKEDDFEIFLSRYGCRILKE